MPPASPAPLHITVLSHRVGVRLLVSPGQRSKRDARSVRAAGALLCPSTPGVGLRDAGVRGGCKTSCKVCLMAAAEPSARVPSGAAVEQEAGCVRSMLGVLRLRGIWDLFFLPMAPFPWGQGPASTPSSRSGCNEATRRSEPRLEVATCPRRHGVLT